MNLKDMNSSFWYISSNIYYIDDSLYYYERPIDKWDNNGSRYNFFYVIESYDQDKIIPPFVKNKEFLIIHTGECDIYDAITITFNERANCIEWVTHNNIVGMANEIFDVKWFDLDGNNITDKTETYLERQIKLMRLNGDKSILSTREFTNYFKNNEPSYDVYINNH